MEERNVKLSLEKAKEWYKKGGELKEVALQAFSKEELTKKDVSHSWEEYLRKNMGINSGYCLQGNAPGVCAAYLNELLPVYPTREYAEAALALSKLLQLRQEWIGNWKPNWRKYNCTNKYVIEVLNNDVSVGVYENVQAPLSFPDKQMAEKFLKDFSNLLETAKHLL